MLLPRSENAAESSGQSQKRSSCCGFFFLFYCCNNWWWSRDEAALKEGIICSILSPLSFFALQSIHSGSQSMRPPQEFVSGKTVREGKAEQRKQSLASFPSLLLLLHGCLMLTRLPKSIALRYTLPKIGRWSGSWIATTHNVISKKKEQQAAARTSHDCSCFLHVFWALKGLPPSGHKNERLRGRGKKKKKK